MKILFRVFFLLFGFFALAFGIDDITSLDQLSKYAPKSEESAKRKPVELKEEEILTKDNFTIDDLKKIAPTDEEDVGLSDDQSIYQKVRVTDLLLSTSGRPKSVYENQIFKIDLKADIQQEIGVDLNITVDKNNDLIWVNKDNVDWLGGNKGIYDTTLWFEANSTKAQLNGITVTMYRNGEFFQKATIKPKIPTIKEIKEKSNFAHIAADELIVKSFKTTKFDDKSNLMTIDLKVKNGNLSSFHLNDGVIKQGVDSIRGDYTDQSGYYFAVFDKNIKKLNFSYFNLKSKKFENFSLDVRVENENLSTQIALNPKESSFKLYRAIAIYALCALLLVMFITSKNTTPLFVAVGLLALNFYIEKPYDKKEIKAGTLIRILPIDSSTIFYKTKKDERVEVFDDNKNYLKIMLEGNKIIGWVKEDDIKS